MKYIDLHCDALTKEGVAVVSGETLRAGDCALQCFAAFVDGSKGEGGTRAAALFASFQALCEGPLAPWISQEGRALLTVEGGEALGGTPEALGLFSSLGVKMVGLTWNVPNALGFPHGERGGLTPLGRACVERMCSLGMLPDVAHGSDELVRDVSAICREKGFPLVCSHAGAREMFPLSRNLSDESIRLIAEGGGVVGLYFVGKFLSRDLSAEGQREALLAHARHIVKTGGEDVLAIGSDFDGAPANAYIESPLDMPKFLSDLVETFGPRPAEKIAFTNPARLFPATEGLPLPREGEGGTA